VSPLTISLAVLDGDRGNAPLTGTAVYAWQCDRIGRYSLYSEGLTDENYLRGVQAANDNGNVTFTSIFPGVYPGRWPHIHLEIYRDLSVATNSGPILKTTQIALPEDVCDEVYATADGYEASVRNMARVSLASDINFRDDRAATQLASVTGSVSGGYVASMNIPV